MAWDTEVGERAMFSLCHISSDDRISVGCETVCLRREESCSVGQVSQPDPRYAFGFVGLLLIWYI